MPEKAELTVSQKAKKFAHDAHQKIDQRRKYTGEPYIVHPAAVAKLVSSVVDDDNMIAAAWLHDVVEDTPMTLKDIEQHFGNDIAGLVSDLTDVSVPEQGNRAARKAIDRAHTAAASPRAKTIKLADLIDNTRSITEHDPQFARVYMAEKRLLLEILQEGDSILYERAQSLVNDYFSSRASDK